jgi:hypothetical protein
MKALSLAAVSAFLVANSAPSFAEGPPGTWSTSTPLPQPRSEHAVIGFSGKVYAIAGNVPKVDGEGMKNNGASTLVEFTTRPLASGTQEHRCHDR